MVDFNKVKVVFFDLDNTLWSGLLSEDNIHLFPNTKKAIELLVENGIVVSVCSKNDFEEAKKALIEQSLWNSIVFPSIDWQPKGQRIKQTLSSMGLRDANAVFIDDAIENIEEVKFYNPNIQTDFPSFLNDVVSFFDGKKPKDKEKTKLQQYKELEKREDNKVFFSTNEEFLRDLNVQVEFIEKDKKFEKRILEMIHKTNQLNFTKIRSTSTELHNDLKKSPRWGVVVAKDKYSFYGVVGFYLFENESTLKHFLFSCRTIGMGLEQFVYDYLQRPKFVLVEPVSTAIKYDSEKVDWITIQKNLSNDHNCKTLNKAKILMKGPCDLQVISGYLSDNGCKIDTEFTFENDLGQTIEHHNSLINLLNCKSLSPSQKKEIIAYAPFGTKHLFETRFFDGTYDVIVLSTLADFTIPMYKHKKDGFYYSCGQSTFPLNKKDVFDKYISNEVYNAGFKFDDKQFQYFSDNFDYIGIDVKTLYETIVKIRSLLPKTTVLILTIGSDTKFDNETNPVYFEAYLYHRKLHELLNKEPIDNVFVVDPNPIIEAIGQKAFTNNVNHYNKQVYLDMAAQISNIIKTTGFESFRISKHRPKIIAKIVRFLKRKKQR